MERERSIHACENIKAQGLSNDQIEPIDISEAVMRRIGERQTAGRFQGRAPHRWAFICAAIGLAVMLSTASVLAASEYLQLRNRDGEVKVRSEIADHPLLVVPQPEEENSPAPSYRDRVLAQIKPGQLLAYSIDNGNGTRSIQYVFDTRIESSYTDFAQLAAGKSAPAIPEPELPDGFAFDYGSVHPILPIADNDVTHAEYDRLLTLFEQRAESEPGKDLYVEEAHWTEANSSELEYSNRQATVRIQAIKDAIGMEALFPSNYSQQIHTIGGIEVILAQAEIQGFPNFAAIWYDEVSSTHYRVSASGSVELTAEAFNRIVASLVKLTASR